MNKEDRTLKVSRRIEAPVHHIFSIVADPHRHVEIDGSGMLREAIFETPISKVGDTFTMKMHRLGEDYLIINHVVEFELDRRIFWKPAPGDTSRSEGHKLSTVGIPAGYIWGYVLAPDSDQATLVTEIFEPGPISEEHLKDGSWINGANPLLESMKATLERLERISLT